MMKISKLNKNIFFKGLIPCVIFISLVFNPNKVFGKIAETENTAPAPVRKPLRDGWAEVRWTGSVQAATPLGAASAQNFGFL